VERLLPDGRAAVRVSRVEACQACESRSACVTLGGQVSDQILVLDNRVRASVGDRVRLHLSESSVITASMILYLLPAGTLLAGAAAGQLLAPTLGWSGDPAAVLGSVLGLALGLLVLRILNQKLGSRSRFVPRIVAIVAPGSVGEATSEERH